MIERKQYRACLKAGWKQEQLEEEVEAAAKTAHDAVESGDILTASLYRHKDMCFLYYEALKKNIGPTDFLDPLTPFLEEWPEENGKTPWAYMYHIFHHSVPEDIAEWTRERTEGKKRIGRIAFLWPDRVFSYVRWHQAIVEEGLLKGDKYQCISLHENILFSYFEEPRMKAPRGKPSSVCSASEPLVLRPLRHLPHIPASLACERGIPIFFLSSLYIISVKLICPSISVPLYIFLYSFP